MAQATADVGRTFEAGVEPIFNNHTLPSGTVYEGQVVTIDSSSNEVQTDASWVHTDQFVGFAAAKAAYADGARTVRVRSRGVIKLTVSDAAALDVGDPVYCTDNSTFTTVADTAGDGSGTAHTKVGLVHRIESGGATSTVMVYFEAASLRSV